jgi:hypothetical protein
LFTKKDAILKVDFRKSLINSTVIGNFLEKICRQDKFDELYPFHIPDSRKNLEIHLKKIQNMVVLVFTPPISGKTRGNPAKWLCSLESTPFNLPGSDTLINAIFQK